MLCRIPKRAQVLEVAATGRFERCVQAMVGPSLIRREQITVP